MSTMTDSTIRDTVADAARRLHSAGVEDARQDAWHLLCHATGFDRATLIASGSDRLDPTSATTFSIYIDRRCRREPVAQILGEREFWSLSFRVNTDVLSPRPETETLVEAAIDMLTARGDTDGASPHRLLDLGTGSGCLLLALLNELPGALGTGVDNSARALNVAQANGRRLGLDGRVCWVQGLWGSALNGVFDLIVSNPPYIEVGDFPGLAPEIRLFEPYQALVAGVDGLAAYRALASDIKRLLAPSGLACLEMGHGQVEAVTEVMRDVGLDCVARRRDLAGIDRCLVVGHDPG